MKNLFLLCAIIACGCAANAQIISPDDLILIKSMGYSHLLEHLAMDNWLYIDARRLSPQEQIDHDLSFGNCMMLNEESKEKFPAIAPNEADGLWCLTFRKNTDSLWAYFYYLTELKKQDIPAYNRYPMGIIYKCSNRRQKEFIEKLRKRGFVLDFAMDNILSYVNNKTHDEISILQAKGVPYVLYYLDQCYPYSINSKKR
jgi:hypothetical protein